MLVSALDDAGAPAPICAGGGGGAAGVSAPVCVGGGGGVGTALGEAFCGAAVCVPLSGGAGRPIIPYVKMVYASWSD